MEAKEIYKKLAFEFSKVLIGLGMACGVIFLFKLLVRFGK